MKKVVSLAIGTSLVLATMAAGAASAGDFFGVKKRAEARENKRHEARKQSLTNVHQKSLKQTANSKDYDRGTKLEIIKQSNERHGARMGQEKLRHRNKLADIRSRNALGMKKRSAAAKPAARGKPAKASKASKPAKASKQAKASKPTKASKPAKTSKRAKSSKSRR